MTNNGIVNIKGNDYMTVARRVELWLEENKANNEGYSIETEVIPNNHNHVVIKATVKYRARTFTGISSISLDTPRQIEKYNPYEVAETSAVGRALGFAGFGIIEGIASADEIVKAGVASKGGTQIAQTPANGSTPICSIHNKPMKERIAQSGGKYFDHRWQIGEEWQKCNGKAKREADFEDLSQYEGDGYES